MHLTKLKLTGFKSFVEPTELPIEPGLTGIVGPNGCGKSNIVEGLRWVMGETAPRQVRAGAMDDMIFNGTAARPARNIAEVTLCLDNAERRAVAGFNDATDIEVTRRIARGEGSTYVVNTQEVRARDVQLLFADVSTGAHSSALVGQGRINDIINAKPAHRRGLLEEAAGITGLHARRHEAELKLRAAEANLERLDDLITALEGQLQSLKRQSRQANRYRRISEQLRETEALLLYLRWETARTQAEAAAAALSGAEHTVTERAREAASAAKHQADAATGLPALREAEAEAAAALRRLTVEQDRLDDEAERLARAKDANTARRAQIETDVERETALASDAQAAMERFAELHDRLVADGDTDPDAEETARQAMEDARQAVEAVEQRLAELAQERARVEAEKRALARQAEEAAARIGRLDDEIARCRTALEERAATDQGERGLEAAEAAVRQAEGEFEQTRQQAAASERALAIAERDQRIAREAIQEVDASLARIEAARSALEILISEDEEETGVIDEVEVDEGYEAALAAALGDDLLAPADNAAPIHWTALSRLETPPALPKGTTPLADVVRAPAPLARRLALTGVVESGNGSALQKKLAPGQRLVDRAGAMWRWDGLVTTADAPTTAGRRLEARGRIAVLDAEDAEIWESREQVETRAEEAAGALKAARRRASDARTARDSASQRLDFARQRCAGCATTAAQAKVEAEHLQHTVARLETERDEAALAKRDATEGAAALAPPDASDDEVSKLEESLAGLRESYDERFRRHDRIAREAAERSARLNEVARERASWGMRATSAESRLAELTARREAAEAEREALTARPAEIEERRQALMTELEAAEATRQSAADALADAEAKAGASDRALKAAEQALAETREARARCEGVVAQAEQAETHAREQIAERLNVSIEEARALAGVEPGAATPEAEQIEAKLHRLTRERENIGPVNLRAEAEAAELEEEIAGLISERADLQAAIARLRQGIAGLNREGRERILSAFTAIDAHFQRLFARLFNGGSAHLELVDADDPLEAGLEIMASPPGKRLQSLSLLSGGEKALTAIALLFAAFLTNPAPVCVLDEVDAPLDDSNVDRFCTLITEIAHETDTRFVVVTHHRMTMSRVDRLFGVTMVERGVSQVVSVDLADAERLRDSA